MSDRENRPRAVGPIAAVAVPLLALCLLGSKAQAIERAIEDIRVVKQGSVATASIALSCPITYLNHTPDTGAELRIRVALGQECATSIGRGFRSELYDSPTIGLAWMREVVFDTPDGNTATIFVRFERIVAFRAQQSRARDTIQVEVVDDTPSAAPIERSPPRPDPVVIVEEPPPRLTEPARRPLRLVQRPAERSTMFVIRLVAGAGLTETAQSQTAAEYPEKTLYISERNIGTRRWQELRLGFFATEFEARDTLDQLRARFPDAIISLADIEEQDVAIADLLVSTAPAEPLTEPAGDADATTASMPAERIAALMAEAADAMRSENYDRSVQIYSRVLEEPQFEHRPEARERLGIAHERSGRRAQAKREYDLYLAEFPDGPDAARVMQRRATLTAAPSQPRAAANGNSDESAWEFWGGLSQYYRRERYQALYDAPERTIQSALTSNLDLAIRRHGRRFELLSRINGSYHYNLLDDVDRRNPADQLQVSNAYINLIDEQHVWSARMGRQSLHKSGVLGRFDGALVNHQWRPGVALTLTLGSPVEFPRHAVDTHRNFIGLSADFDRLVGRWDFSVFSVLQTVDGISDRQAIGAEARFRGNEWDILGAIDADASYGVLNSAMLIANWRAAEKLTVNGRLNVGTAPFLSTHNALIGQTVRTISELLTVYTEPQVRRLARNRTAQAYDGALGLAWPLLDRFQLNLDVSVATLENTIESAGVAALPDTGTQTAFNASVIGSSVFKSGDTTVLSLRRGSTRTVDTDTLIFDIRLPATRRLRINPRLALTARREPGSGNDQLIAAPLLRIAYRSGNHHRFETEIGGQWSDRTLPDERDPEAEQEERSSSYFVNLGYWWEF